MARRSRCVDHQFVGNGQGYASSDARARRGLPRLLHRYVFLEKHGYLPSVVMHACDNTRCINVKHLVAGTWDANNKDRARKGRSAKARLDKRKLSPASVHAIRRRYARRRIPMDKDNGVVALARDYSVDTNVIYQIVERRTYAEQP